MTMLVGLLTIYLATFTVWTAGVYALEYSQGDTYGLYIGKSQDVIERWQ